MAERRMFAKTIIDSDAFLDMPLTTQALYFHLSMRADDDGFINNPKKIMRMIGASDDELRLLVAKSFIIPFESGVCVIKHWKIHNYLRSDRYKPTVYVEEKSMLNTKENKAYSMKPLEETTGIPLGIQDGIPDGIPSDNQWDTQVRLGKDRLGKVRIGQERIGEFEGATVQDKEPPDDERPAPPPHHVPYEQVKNLYNEICTSLPRCTAMSDARRKAIKARFASGYTLEDFRQLFTKAEASSFMRGANGRNWRATFDWLLKDANMAKVLDGNYDDHQAAVQEQAKPQRSSNPFLEMLRKEEAEKNGQNGNY
jgi:hypothetical protein